MLVLAHLSGALSTLISQGFDDKKEGTLILYHSQREISTKFRPKFDQLEFITAFSLGFFVVNIFCVQPKLTAEEANATRKFHSTDLRLRLHAAYLLSCWRAASLRLPAPIAPLAAPEQSTGSRS